MQTSHSNILVITIVTSIISGIIIYLMYIISNAQIQWDKKKSGITSEDMPQPVLKRKNKQSLSFGEKISLVIGIIILILIIALGCYYNYPLGPNVSFPEIFETGLICFFITIWAFLKKIFANLYLLYALGLIYYFIYLKNKHFSQLDAISDKVDEICSRIDDIESQILEIASNTEPEINFDYSNYTK